LKKLKRTIQNENDDSDDEFVIDNVTYDKRNEKFKI